MSDEQHSTPLGQDSMAALRDPAEGAPEGQDATSEGRPENGPASSTDPAEGPDTTDDTRA